MPRTALVLALFAGLGSGLLAARRPDEPSREALLELARTHRDAIAASGRIEKEADELRVRAVLFPDAQRWMLIGELIAGLEAEEPIEAVRERIARVRTRFRTAAGRPGFEIELRHREAPDASDRAVPRSVHLFPADPDGLLRALYGEKVADWTPLEAPRGLARGRVRIAKHYKTKDRRYVPLVQELEPKQDRFVLEGESGSFAGALPEKLGELAGGTIALRLLAFDRFRGPSPEPFLLDLNAEGHVFERERTLELTRSWPPPWPPLPAELERFLDGPRGGDRGGE